jgi:hypothetical protein
MKRLFSTKSLAAAGVAICALATASAAQARTDVFFSVQAPGLYVQSAPVYVQPEPVYVAPGPVYVQPQPFYGTGYYGDDGWYGRHHHRRHGHRYGPYGDIDHDGVPNRYDRFPQNRYRR